MTIFQDLYSLTLITKTHTVSRREVLKVSGNHKRCLIGQRVVQDLMTMFIVHIKREVSPLKVVEIMIDKVLYTIKEQIMRQEYGKSSARSYKKNLTKQLKKSEDSQYSLTNSKIGS